MNKVLFCLAVILCSFVASGCAQYGYKKVIVKTEKYKQKRMVRQINNEMKSVLDVERKKVKKISKEIYREDLKNKQEINP